MPLIDGYILAYYVQKLFAYRSFCFAVFTLVVLVFMLFSTGICMFCDHSCVYCACLLPTLQPVWLHTVCTTKSLLALRRQDIDEIYKNRWFVNFFCWFCTLYYWKLFCSHLILIHSRCRNVVKCQKLPKAVIDSSYDCTVYSMHIYCTLELCGWIM